MKPFIILLLSVNYFVFSYSQTTTQAPLSEFSLSFIPDNTFKGSALTGWHTLGDAEWQAKDGELIGKAKANSTGGWLVLDKGYQDIGFHSLFKTTGSSLTAVLFRMEKVSEGLSSTVGSEAWNSRDLKSRPH